MNGRKSEKAVFQNALSATVSKGQRAMQSMACVRMTTVVVSPGSVRRAWAAG
jgi:hypothetical protein